MKSISSTPGGKVERLRVTLLFKVILVHESLLPKKTLRAWSRIAQLELQLPMTPVGLRLHVNG
jgi:hypothetical protein